MWNVDQTIRKKPYTFINNALKLLKTQMPVIVEIGSMRQSCEHSLDEYDKVCCNDGHSSLLLARAAGDFHTVDISMECAKLTRQQLKKYNLWDKSNVYCGDGLKFLKNFDKKIDLLYLDAWDVELPNHAEMHLEAFKVAETKLNNNAVILIDDTDVGYSAEKGFHNDEEALGGKGRLLIPFLIDRKEYTLVFKGRQTCFLKNE